MIFVAYDKCILFPLQEAIIKFIDGLNNYFFHLHKFNLSNYLMVNNILFYYFDLRIIGHILIGLRFELINSYIICLSIMNQNKLIYA